MVFHTPLADFDGLITLRKEALPFLERALPASAAQLAGALKEQGRAGQDGAVAEPHKMSRATLRGFPQGGDLDQGGFHLNLEMEEAAELLLPTGHPPQQTADRPPAVCRAAGAAGHCQAAAGAAGGL